jgi:hypothetical protein
MKLLSGVVLIALLFIATGMRAIGSRPGDSTAVIVSVDIAGSTVTVAQGGQTRLYHLDPFANVYLDGSESSLKQLSAGMIVNSLSLSDPTTVSELKASEGAGAVPAGAAPAAAAAAMPAAELAALMPKLAGSYWIFPGGTSFFYLNGDGRMVDDWHGRAQGLWTFADPHTLSMKNNGKELSGVEPPKLLPLNGTYTVAGQWVRLAQPTAAMAAKVARALR